jgi:hypothetical protein
MYYRVTVNGIGIYEAVQKNCPKEDNRKINKPDGSWLNKVGENYPGTISFWTEKGWKKYNSSGLFGWHKSVVNGKVKVIKTQILKNIVYEDEFQVIVEKFDTN